MHKNHLISRHSSVFAYFFIALFICSLAHCSFKPENTQHLDSSKILKNKSDTLKSISLTDKTGNLRKIESGKPFGGPPFKDTCFCHFKEFGIKNNGNQDYHFYFSGKGWDYKSEACSWTFGELISNTYPSREAADTNVMFFTIHLLDLENFSIPKGKDVYGSDSIKKHVIAVYKVNRKNWNTQLIFDPFKTGKYPQPSFLEK